MTRIVTILFCNFILVTTTYSMEHVPTIIVSKTPPQQKTPKTSPKTSPRIIILSHDSNDTKRNSLEVLPQSKNRVPEEKKQSTSRALKKALSYDPGIAKKTLSIDNLLLPIKETAHPRDTLLLTAIKRKDFDTAQNILTLDINHCDENGNTALILASKKESLNEAIINLLFKKKKLDPNIKNHVKMTFLHYLALGNNYTIIEKYLPDPRVDASIRNKNRQTPRELIDQSAIEQHRDWANQNKNSMNNYSKEIGEKLEAQAMKVINIRRHLFANTTVHTTTRNHALALTFNGIIDTIDSIHSLDQEAEKIKLSILTTITNQNVDDRNLPQQACLPEYANDKENTFIKKVLSLKLQNISKLDINQQDTEGNTPLMITIIENDPIFMNWLLERKTLKLNVQNLLKKTAFHYLILSNDYPVIERFLQDPRLDSSITDKEQKTAENLFDTSSIEKYKTWTLEKHSIKKADLNEITEQSLKSKSEKTDALLKKLSYRTILDTQINNHARELTSNKMINPSTIIPSLDQEIKIIKSSLPKYPSNEFDLPKYATDDFMTQILLLRLPSNSPILLSRQPSNVWELSHKPLKMDKKRFSKTL